MGCRMPATEIVLPLRARMHHLSAGQPVDDRRFSYTGPTDEHNSFPRFRQSGKLLYAIAGNGAGGYDSHAGCRRFRLQNRRIDIITQISANVNVNAKSNANNNINANMNTIVNINGTSITI